MTYTREQLVDPKFWDQRLAKINEKLQRNALLKEGLQIMKSDEWKTKFFTERGEAYKSLEKVIENMNKKGLGEELQIQVYQDKLFQNQNTLYNSETKDPTSNRAAHALYDQLALSYIFCINTTNIDPTEKFKKKKGELTDLKNGSVLGFATTFLVIPKESLNKKNQDINKYKWEIKSQTENGKNNSIEINFEKDGKLKYDNNNFKPFVYLNFLASNGDFSGLGQLLFMSVASIFRGLPILLELDPLQSDIEALRKVYQGYGLKNVRDLKTGSSLHKLFRFMIDYRTSSFLDSDAFDTRMPNIWMVYENKYDKTEYARGLFIASS